MSLGPESPPGQWLRPGHVEPMPPARDSPSSELDCIFATGDKNTGGKVEQSAEWSSSGNFINGAAKLRHATRTLIMRKTCDVAIKLFVLLLYTAVWPDLAGAWRQAHYEVGLEILLSVVIVRSDRLTPPNTTRRRQSAVSWRPETVHKTAKTWEI